MPTTTANKGQAIRPIDVHVGQRLQARRLQLGMSEGQLAEALAVSVEQLRKYENGANRIVASRLYDLSQILEVPVEYFFANPPWPDDQPGRPDTGEGTADSPTHQEVEDLVHAYYSIASPALRKRLFDLVRFVGSVKP